MNRAKTSQTPGATMAALLLWATAGGCVATITDESEPVSRTETATDGERASVAPNDWRDPSTDAGAGRRDACEPDCAGRDCGPDGCGGECGMECAQGRLCTAAGLCELEDTRCPPHATGGNGVGEIAGELTLYDCDGTPRSSHSACGTPLYVYSHSESCGSCIAFARDSANAAYSELRARGAEMYFVIAIGRSGPPDAALCQRLRSEYALEMPVFFIPSWTDFMRVYPQGGSGGGALLDDEHRIVMAGSLRSSYDRARILAAVPP